MSEQIPYILQGADSPRDVMVCAFVRIVPARFALSSEEQPPVQGRLPAYMQAVPERNNLKYTLRLLRNGYIHVFHKPDKQHYSWKVENGKVKQTELCSSDVEGKESAYISLPAWWEGVHIAFSDAPGEDFWHQYLDSEELLISRMHELRWKKGKGLASPDTLCGSVDDMLEWVEEFRNSPGHVRALFEYEDNTVQEYFDPDLDHLKLTSFPAAIIKRWHATKRWDDMDSLPSNFLWLCSSQEKELEAEATTIPRELKKYTFSGLIALSDPAGICLECAALHHASLKVWNDFSTWYAHAHTLCLYLKEWDSMPSPFARQAIVYDPDRLRMYRRMADTPRFSDFVSGAERAVYASGRPISEAFLPWFKTGMACLDPHLDALAEFWLAWLNGTDRFSFARAAGDYNTGARGGSNGWETLLSLCTHKMTAHERVLLKVRENFERDSPLAGMFRERLKNSLWASGEDDPDDRHMGFTLLLINFTGLLPSRLDVARGMKAMPPYAEEMFFALCGILIKKLGEVPADSPETDHLDLMKFLVAAQGLTTLPEPGAASDKVPFGILLQPSVSLDRLDALAGRARDFEIAANLLKTGDLAVQSFRRFLEVYPLLRQTVRIIAARGYLMSGGRSGGAGPDPASAAESRELSSGSKGLLNLAGLGIAGLTLLQSLYSQATDKKRGRWGWVDVTANVFGVIELYHKSKLHLFSRPYEMVAAPLEQLLGAGPAWARRAAGYAKLPFTAAWAGRLAGVGASIWSAYTALEETRKGEDRVALGNWMLSAGSLMLLVKGLALGGLVFSIVGLVFVMFGKTSRLQYRIANCYFGEKNAAFPGLLARYDPQKTVERAPADFVREIIERAGGFDPESYQAVVPFSLRQGFVPAGEDRKAPEFYEKRSAQLALDLKALELSLLGVSLYALYDRANGLFHVHLTVPFAAPSASLRVKSMHVVECSSIGHRETPLYEVSELGSIRMGCTLKQGCPCWFFAFPVPGEVLQAQKNCDSWNSSRNKGMEDFHFLALKVKVDFEYASEADWQSQGSTRDALNLLVVEDAAYHGVDDDFKLRTAEQYRVLKDCELMANIAGLAFLRGV